MTRRVRRFLLVLALALVGTPQAAWAHSPDPVFGGALWGQDQYVTYRWKSGQVPPSWLQPAINAAAADSNASRASRAAVFSYSGNAGSTVGYGEPTGCGTGGLACFNRSGAPYAFTMSFRAQGYRFDFGPLNWCQYNANWATGCFDAQNIALDEFGHVLILNHHENPAYLDAVVQRISVTKPNSGWNVHHYGRCDTAALQRRYDMPSWSAPYSTCLDLASVSALTASATSVRSGTTVTFSASVRTATNSAYDAASNNPLHGRTVVLQRAAIGSTSWIDVATMSPVSAAGAYSRAVSISAAYQWRVSFRPTGEGVRPSSSAAVIVRIQ